MLTHSAEGECLRAAFKYFPSTQILKIDRLICIKLPGSACEQHFWITAYENSLFCLGHNGHTSVTAHTTSGWSWICQDKWGSMRTITSAEVLGELELGQPLLCLFPTCAEPCGCDHMCPRARVARVILHDTAWQSKAGICDIRMLFVVSLTVQFPANDLLR